VLRHADQERQPRVCSRIDESQRLDLDITISGGNDVQETVRRHHGTVVDGELEDPVAARPRLWERRRLKPNTNSSR
jgi:hypothetical protein